MTEKVKRLDEYQQSKPVQLSLFAMIAPEDKKYSNTIELYDFIPKYFWGKTNRVNDQFLPSLEREFEYRSQKYKVRVVPARIVDKDGKERDYYPGQREELVEDALRKLACNDQGVFLDDQAGVTFTLYQLREELKSMGHGYKISEIRDALSVCVKTSIEVSAKDGSKVLMSHIFETVGLQVEGEQNNTGKATKAFVRFNPLVTQSIKAKTFRQLNYEVSMSYRSVISRQLHKRMSHQYTQASLINTYEIMLSTLIRDFGLKTYKRINDNLKEITTALKEMQEKEIILEFKINKVLDTNRSNKLTDAKVVIRPHPKFAGEMIKANKRHGTIKAFSAE